MIPQTPNVQNVQSQQPFKTHTKRRSPHDQNRRNSDCDTTEIAILALLKMTQRSSPKSVIESVSCSPTPPLQKKQKLTTLQTPVVKKTQALSAISVISKAPAAQHSEGAYASSKTSSSPAPTFTDVITKTTQTIDQLASISQTLINAATLQKQQIVNNYRDIQNMQQSENPDEQQSISYFLEDRICRLSTKEPISLLENSKDLLVLSQLTRSPQINRFSFKSIIEQALTLSISTKNKIKSTFDMLIDSDKFTQQLPFNYSNNYHPIDTRASAEINTLQKKFSETIKSLEKTVNVVKEHPSLQKKTPFQLLLLSFTSLKRESMSNNSHP